MIPATAMLLTLVLDLAAAPFPLLDGERQAVIVIASGGVFDGYGSPNASRSTGTASRRRRRSARAAGPLRSL